MDLKTFAATCKIEEVKCAEVLIELGYEFGMPFSEPMAAPLKEALMAAGAKLFPAIAVIEALKAESGIRAVPAAAPAPAPATTPPAVTAGPIQVTVVSDKAPAEMRDHELLTALAAAPRDREIIKAMEARELMVVAIDGTLSATLTTDMWNAAVPPNDADEYWLEVQNRIIRPSDLGAQLVLLCPVTLDALRGGTHQRTHTTWGTDVDALTAARWASDVGKLGTGDVIAQHAAWGERADVLRAEFEQKCKLDTGLRARYRAQIEQLHSPRRASSAPATRRVTRGGSATIDDSEGRLSARDVANAGQEALTNRMHRALCGFLPSEFELAVFRLGIPTANLRTGTQSDRASDVIHYMLPRGRIAELTLMLTQQLGSDAWLTDTRTT